MVYITDGGGWCMTAGTGSCPKPTPAGMIYCFGDKYVPFPAPPALPGPLRKPTALHKGVSGAPTPLLPRQLQLIQTVIVNSEPLAVLLRRLPGR